MPGIDDPGVNIQDLWKGKLSQCSPSQHCFLKKGVKVGMEAGSRYSPKDASYQGIYSSLTYGSDTGARTMEVGSESLGSRVRVIYLIHSEPLLHIFHIALSCQMYA